MKMTYAEMVSSVRNIVKSSGLAAQNKKNKNSRMIIGSGSTSAQRLAETIRAVMRVCNDNFIPVIDIRYNLSVTASGTQPEAVLTIELENEAWF